MRPLYQMGWLMEGRKKPQEKFGRLRLVDEHQILNILGMRITK